MSQVDNFPAQWGMRRLRFDAQLNPLKSRLDLPADTEVSFVPMDAVGELGGLALNGTRPIEEVYNGYTYFADGDIVIAKITPCFENGKGALAEGLTNGVAFGTTELHVVRPQPGIDARFLFYLTIAHDFRAFGEAEMLGAGGQKRVPEEFLKDWRAPLPPLETQQRIARFLDEKTARIDRLIEKKRALLDRLDEQRQALITRAVTKGLNPDARMKPSGIDWLGDIPTHWEVKRLDRLNDYLRPIRYGIVLPGPHVPGGVPIIKGGDVRPERLKRELLNCTAPEIDAANPNARIAAGDLVYTIRGSFGDVEIATEELAGCNLTQDTARISPLTSVDAQWLLMALKSSVVRGNLAAGSLGATIKGINIFDLRRALLPLPPFDEQKAIAAYLAARRSNLDDLASTIRVSIERLAEYRAALITAAVTGKLEIA
ncbi:restriction endonuclease subunit S [Agrobacterium radiobacter]|uniref:restriction endonuclease subunit S n=1 Tax=Agrobacterium radiobacter TaxID=362 RepID=UPI000DCF6EC7